MAVVTNKALYDFALAQEKKLGNDEITLPGLRGKLTGEDPSASLRSAQDDRGGATRSTRDDAKERAAQTVNSKALYDFAMSQEKKLGNSEITLPGLKGRLTGDEDKAAASPYTRETSGKSGTDSEIDDAYGEFKLRIMGMANAGAYNAAAKLIDQESARQGTTMTASNAEALRKYVSGAAEKAGQPIEDSNLSPYISTYLSPETKDREAWLRELDLSQAQKAKIRASAEQKPSDPYAGMKTEFKRQQAAEAAELQKVKEEQERRAQDYGALMLKPDFEEKSKPDIKKTGKAEYSPVANMYTDTGYEDVLYAAINGDETAQRIMQLQDAAANTTHQGWYELPQNTVRIFNYLYTSDPQEAYDFLSFAQDRGSTGAEAFTYGLLEGSGVMSAAAALGSAIDKDATEKAYEEYKAEAGRVGQQHQGLYTAGNIAGNIGMMTGISKGLGAIKGFSALPTLARGAVSGAGTLGASAAIHGAGEAATGNISVGEYLKDIGTGMLSGAAGGSLSGAVNSAGLKLLRGMNKTASNGGVIKAGSDLIGTQNKVLPNVLLGGASSLGYSIGVTGVQELSKAITDENYTPNWAEIGTSGLTAFVLGAFNAYLQTSQISKANRAQMEQLTKSLEEAYGKWDAATDPAIKARYAEQTAEWADRNLRALAELQIVGADQQVRDAADFLWNIEQQMLGYISARPDFGTGIGAGGAIVPSTGALAATGRQNTHTGATSRPQSQTPAMAAQAVNNVTAPDDIAPEPQGLSLPSLEDDESTAVNDNPAQHTQEEQRIIEEYKNSTDDRIRDAFQKYLDNPQASFSRYKISDVSDRQAQDAARLLGGNYSEYTNNINKNGILHTLEEHGPNGRKNNSMADMNDAARIGYVLDNYDTVEKAVYEGSGDLDTSAEFRDKNNRPAPMLKYSKKVNGTYYIIEAIPDSNYKKFWVVSAYIENKKPEGITQAPNVTSPRITPEASLPSLPSDKQSISQPAAPVNTGPQNVFEAMRQQIPGQAETEARENMLWTAPKDNGGWKEYYNGDIPVYHALQITDPELFDAFTAEASPAAQLGDTPIINAYMATWEDVRQGTISPMAAAKLLSDAYRSGGTEMLKALYNPNTGNLYPSMLEMAKQTDTEHKNGGITNGSDQTTSAGTQPAGSAGVGAGREFSDGGRGRDAGERTGGQAGQLERGGQNSPADQIRKANQRQNLGRSLSLEAVSGRQLGIVRSTENASIRVLPESHWDSELKQAAEEIRQTGKEPVFILGGIEVRKSDGTVGRARGAKTDSRIIIQADHTKLSVTQIEKHELWHAISDQEPGMIREAKGTITSTYEGKAEFQQVLDRYIRSQRGIIDITEDMTEEETEAALRLIEDELFADAYAKINTFGAGSFTEQADQTMRKYRGSSTANRNTAEATDRTTGPPEKYMLHDIPVPTYEELIEKPDIQVTDIRRARKGSFAQERSEIRGSDAVNQMFKAPILNRDTNERIFITPQTITHTFSNLGWEQLELAEHLPEITENAVLTHAEQSRNAPGDHTTGVYTLFGAALTDAGVQPVKLTVKEYNIEGQDIPATVRDYLGSGIQPETFASVYDGKVLVLEGIEKEGPSSSAITDAAQNAAVNYPSSPSAISVKDLLSLVKGDAEKYIPAPRTGSDAGNTYFSYDEEELRGAPQLRLPGGEDQLLDRAKEMLDNGASKNDVYNETGLVVMANGNIQNGIGGEIIGRYERGGGNEGKLYGVRKSFGSGEIYGRENRENVGGNIGRESSEGAAYGKAWRTLPADTRGRITEATSAHMQNAESEGQKLFSDYPAPELFAERFFNMLSHGRIVAEQWANLIPDVQGLMDEIEGMIGDADIPESKQIVKEQFSMDDEDIPLSSAEYTQRQRSGLTSGEKRIAAGDKAEAKGKKKKTKPVAQSKAIIAKNDLRKTVMNLFSIPAGMKKELGAIVDGFADRIIRQGSIDQRDMDTFFDRMYSEGMMTVPADDYARAGRESVQGSRIHVSDSLKEEFGDDWNSFRKRAFAAGIYLTGDINDRSVDSVNAELSSSFPGIFDENSLDMRDMLEKVVQLAEDGKDENMSLAEYTRMLSRQEYVSEDEILDNMERQLDWALRTFAEKAKLELNLRDRTGVKIAQERERAAKTLENERARQAQSRAKERDARREMARRQTENKALREMQQKTLKQLQWLSRNRSKAPEELRAAWDEVLGDLDIYAVGAANEMNWSEKYGATWRDLADMYKAAKENDPNFLPSKELERIVARLDNAKIADMDVNALQDLYKAAVGLRTEYYNRNNVINDEQHRLFADVYTDSKKEIENAAGGYKRNKVKHAVDKFANMEQLTPMNFLERMGGWDRDGAFYSMARQLERGEREAKDYRVKAERMLEDFTRKHEDWIKKADGQGKDAIWYELEVPELLELGMGDKPIFGNTIKVYMTPAQKVHMYLESKNYDNLRHMTGGRTFADRELYSMGERQEAFEQGRTVRLAPETVKKIVSDLTPEEAELAKILEKYYNDFATKKINEKSNALYGYDKAMGKNYAPIYTNQNYVNKEIGKFDVTAEGVGNLKARQVSKNPSYNIGAFDAFERHIDQTARFVGYAIPARNWDKLLKWGEKDNSLKDVITHKWGGEAKQYITDLLTRLQGGAGESEKTLGQLSNKLLSNYITAVFGANPGIVLKQAASFPQFASVLGWENMPNPKQLLSVDEDLINRYTSELAYRKLGYSTPETAQLKNNPGRLDTNKVTKFLFRGGAITAMDAATVKRAWPWAENKVRLEHPELEKGTPEQIAAGESPFYKKVAEEFEDAVSLTQPMYDEMHRADIMKNGKGITRAFTMFKTVPLQQYNSMRRAFGEMKAAKARAEKAAGNAKEDAQAEYKKAAKAAGATVAATIASVLMLEAIEFLNQLAKNKGKKYRDNEGELTPGSAAEKLARDAFGDLAGMMIVGSEISDLLANIFMGEKLYSIEIPGGEQLNEIVDTMAGAAGDIKDFVSGLSSVISNGGDAGEYIRRHGGDYAGAVKDLAEKLATYIPGLPIENIEKYAMGAVQNISPELYAELQDFFDTPDKNDLKGTSGAVTEVRVRNIMNARGIDTDDETASALAELYSAGYKQAVPTDTPNSISVDGEDRKLNAYQQQTYDRVWNGVVSDSLEELVSSDAFEPAEPKSRANMIDKLYDYAAEKAKEVLFDDYETDSATKKTDEMLAAGVSAAEWTALRQGFSDITNNKDLTSYERGEQKRELLRKAPLTDEQKLEAYLNLTNSEGRVEDLRNIMETGLNFDRTMDVFDEFERLRTSEDMSAGQKATAFAKWVDQQGYSTEQKSMIRDQLKYFSQIPAEAGRYDKLTEAGLSSDAAYDLTGTLSALSPEDGQDSVSDMQRLRAIADGDLSVSDKIAAIGTVIGTDMTTEAGNPSQYAKMRQLLDDGVTIDEFLDLKEAGQVDGYIKYLNAAQGRNYGVTPDMYIEYRNILKTADKDNSGSVSQAEAEAAIDSISGDFGNGLILGGGSLTNEQKAVLWQLANSGWKGGSNPFNTAVGTAIYNGLHTTSSGGSQTGSGLPSLAGAGGNDELRGLSLPSLAG